MQEIKHCGLFTFAEMGKKKVVLYHILGWITYLLIIALGADKVDKDFILKSLSGTLPAIALFYINILLIFPRYLKHKNYTPAIIFTMLACVAATGIRALFTNSFPGILPPFDTIMFWVQFRVNILFAGISFAYWFALKNYRDEKRWQQLEKEMAEAKLMYLKNQLNPHFLYNSLSLLYSKTLPLSSETSELVGKISDMLRYSLDEPEDNGLVSLEKEATHIKNYVDIHQLRFNNTLNIAFEITGDMASKRIAPMMLITFVENAFKHGKLNDAGHPVTIQLVVNKNDLRFNVSNPKATGRKEISSGIGLVNVKNRLQLLYPETHSLEIKDEAQYYSVDLTIRNIA
ncbi:MAG: histidine kinase [Chitinophagaceae bacterium]|nr:histidine kinase [Chitinophagaceae bacterium]MCW5925605.1 histidine kinase [Chitinophagaceae bacterium]